MRGPSAPSVTRCHLWAVGCSPQAISATVLAVDDDVGHGHPGSPATGTIGRHLPARAGALQVPATTWHGTSDSPHQADCLTLRRIRVKRQGKPAIFVHVDGRDPAQSEANTIPPSSELSPARPWQSHRVKLSITCEDPLHRICDRQVFLR